MTTGSGKWHECSTIFEPKHGKSVRMLSSTTIGYLRNRLWSGSLCTVFVNSRQNGSSHVEGGPGYVEKSLIVIDHVHISWSSLNLDHRPLNSLYGFFDELSHRMWLRDVDRVTARSLDDCRTCVLGHETLGQQWDHLVVGGDQVPAWPGLPRWLADHAAQCLLAPRDLRIG